MSAQQSARFVGGLGIGLVPYSPLGRGLLTGSITTEPPAGDSRATAYFPRFQGEALEANLKLVDAIRGLADAHGCTPANSRWPGCWPRVTTWCRFPAPVG